MDLPVCESACVCVSVCECVSVRVRESESVGVCAPAHAPPALPAATCRVVCRVQRKKASIAAGGNEKTFAESGDVSWLNKVRAVAPWLRLVVSSCCGQVKLCDSRYRCRPRHSWPVAVDPGAAAAQCRTAGLVALAAATAAYLSCARTSKRPMRRATTRLCTCRTTSRSSSIAPRAAWTRHAGWCSLLVRRGSSFHSPAASPAYIALRGLHCKLGRVSSLGTSAMAVFCCNTASGAALDGIRPQADRWR
jgi:hypothetical protein